MALHEDQGLDARFLTVLVERTLHTLCVCISASA